MRLRLLPPLLASAALLALAGCSSAPAGTPVPNLVGQWLDQAKKKAEKAGFPNTESTDVHGGDHKRVQVRARDWIVCSEDPSAGTKSSGKAKITLGVVKGGENCPDGRSALSLTTS